MAVGGWVRVLEPQQGLCLLVVLLIGQSIFEVMLIPDSSKPGFNPPK